MYFSTKKQKKQKTFELSLTVQYKPPTVRRQYEETRRLLIGQSVTLPVRR